MYYRAERTIFLILALLTLWVGTLALQSPTNVEWSGFMFAMLLPLLLILLSVAMRKAQVLQMTSIAFMAYGVYAIHSNLVAIVTYLHFPLSRPLIDTHLFAFDALFGYDWVAAVEWLARYPEAAQIMRVVYGSSILQIMAMLVLLAILRQSATILKFVLCGMIGATTTVVFWSLWPSFGPSAYLDVSTEVMDSARLVVRPEYGAHLMHLAEHGLENLSKHMILGSVAFPSFHTIMLLMVLWYARGTWLLWPALLFNLPMLPAIAIHGGHHVIDIAGGAACFALAAWAAARISAPDEARLATLSLSAWLKDRSTALASTLRGNGAIPVASHRM